MLLLLLQEQRSAAETDAAVTMFKFGEQPLGEHPGSALEPMGDKAQPNDLQKRWEVLNETAVKFYHPV